MKGKSENKERTRQIWLPQWQILAATVLAGSIGFVATAVRAERTVAGGVETVVEASPISSAVARVEKRSTAAQPAQDISIRPFQFHASDEALADLKRRIKATKWPSQELVADDTQGVRLATMQKLADYWANQYDWRKAEANLNKYPQFVTNIDGVDIHFIHVRSKNENALPVIITHGWPGSVIEQLKIIEL